MRWTIERELTRWQEQGLLTPDKVEELRASLDDGHSARGIRIFAVLGAVLAGLGIILFVSSHWDTMGPAARVVVLLAAYAAVAIGAIVMGRRHQPRVAEALWLLATLVLGANIFLIAQNYHFQLTYWQGTLRWMIGALVLGWVLRSRLQAAVAIPLGLLTLGWLGSSGGWFFPDQWEFLFSDGGLRPILPLLGVGLVSLSLLAGRNRSWDFLSASSFGWGLGLLVLAAVVSTAASEVAEGFYGFSGRAIQFGMLAGIAALLTGALIYGSFPSSLSKLLLGLITTLSALMLVQPDGVHWLEAEIGRVHLLFGAYVVAVFALSLMTIWTGVRSGRAVLVNAGMVTCAILIFTQYFNWSLELLDRSLVFIFGGLLLLGLAVVLEKKRRSLLEQMRLAGGESS